MSSLGVLQRYARGPATSGNATAQERCQLCAGAIGGTHSHVVDLEQRVLCCACRPCALLFVKTEAARGRFRTVPDRVLNDPELVMDEAKWSSLNLPVRLAFFFHNTLQSRWVAHYPSPAGATECELPLEAWTQLSAESPLISAAEPDVEAILAYGRRGEERFEVLLVPIDACYQLVATIRRLWRGFDGGDPVREAIETFFTSLRARSRSVSGARR